MESTNAERRSRQHGDGTEGSSKNSSLHPRSCSSSSTADSSLFLDSCNCKNGCTDCDYGHCDAMIWRWSKKKESARDAKARVLKSLFVLFPYERDAESLGTTKATKKAVARSKTGELLKDYCPYSSDNCGCSSGCTDCDYGLYTYTTKNKSKLKRKVCVRSSNGFKPLKASERSRRTAKSFSSVHVLRKEKAKSPETLGSCYPESSSSCNRKSGNVKRDFELYAARNRIRKTMKETSAKISRKRKTTKIVRPLKLSSSKKVSKNAAAKVSERDVEKNWFLDSSNSSECNSSCMDYEEHTTTKRKRLRNKSERARASMNPRMSELPSVIDESVKNKTVSKKTAGTSPERRESWSSWDCSESDFTDEDRCPNNIHYVARKLNCTILSESEL